MPYPSPIIYPSASLYPGFNDGTGGQSVSFGNIVLGRRDINGVTWSITKMDGWDGSSASTSAFTQRARSHGSTASKGYLSARFISIEGHIRAPSLKLLEDARDQLNAAVTLEDFQVIVSESRRPMNITVRRQGAVLINAITDTLASYSILIGARDPRKFGDLQTFTTLLPSSSGGRTYPATYPIRYTGVSNTGVIRVNNPGTEEAPVWLRIDGPIPAGGWTVTHVGKQQSLAFASSLALGSGEFVTVDMDRREILAQGQSARAGYVTSRGWFTLDPGDNDIAFSAATYSSTAQLTLATKPSWS